jgi:hypothetical protein
LSKITPVLRHVALPRQIIRNDPERVAVGDRGIAEGGYEGY